MWLDLRKTALMAAVTLGLVSVHCMFLPAWAMGTEQDFQWPAVSCIVVGLLFGAPLPVLMAMLYKTGITPAVSCKMRYLALTTAAIAGVFLALPRFIGLLQAAYRSLPYINSFSGPTVAARLGGWLENFYFPYAWDAVKFLADLAIILFLLFLTPRQGELSSQGGSATRVVKRTALIATIMGGLAVVLTLYVQIYSAVKFAPAFIVGLGTPYGPATRWHYILRASTPVIRLLFWVVTAWIVYKSLQVLVENEPVEEIRSAKD